MAEEQKSQGASLDMDDFLGVEKTPEAETPSQDGDSVEQETVEETPAEKNADSDDGTAEATEKQTEKTPPEKTPEQLKEDRAHFQTKYQEAKAELDAVKEKYQSAYETGEVEEKPAEQKEQSKVDTLREMLGNKGDSESDEELRDMLREDPILALRVQGAYIQKVLEERDEAAKAANAKAEREAAFKAEEAEAKRIFNKWREENDVTDEEVNKAVESMKASNVKGRPVGVTDMIMKDITYNRFVRNAATQMKEIAAEVSQKVKTQALTTQPDAGGKDTEKTKYQEDILADKFGPSRVSDALKGLFG